jgi:hypothetical protein
MSIMAVLSGTACLSDAPGPAGMSDFPAERSFDGSTSSACSLWGPVAPAISTSVARAACASRREARRGCVPNDGVACWNETRASPVEPGTRSTVPLP